MRCWARKLLRIRRALLLASALALFASAQSSAGNADDVPGGGFVDGGYAAWGVGYGRAKPFDEPIKTALRGVRRLQQVDDAKDEDETECLLTRTQVGRLLDAVAGTWLLSDDALDEIEEDVQRVIDCTRYGDAVLFNVTRRLRPKSRISIRWNLTVSAHVEATTAKDGIFPRSSTSVSFTCPRSGGGVFRIRTRNALLANLRFEDCELEAGGIVEVDSCSSKGTGEQIRLHHVAFVSNSFRGASGMRVLSPACADVELVDVKISNNNCSGHGCGAVLSGRSKLRNVSAGDNLVPDPSSLNSSSLLAAEPGAVVRATGLNATSNKVCVLHASASALNVSDSSFERNSLVHEDGVALSACIHLDNSSAAVTTSSFTANEGHRGTSIRSSGSNLTIFGSEFSQNRAEQDGGSVFVDHSVLSVEKSRFEHRTAKSGGFVGQVASNTSISSSSFDNGSAADEGGAVYARNAALTLQNCTFSNNNASGDGGAVSCLHSTSLNLTDSVFESNGARFGGALSLEERCDATVRNSSFFLNKAEMSGGSFYVAGGRLNVSGSDFQNGSARNGGMIYHKNGTVFISGSNLTYGRAQFGAGIAGVEGGFLELVGDRLTENNATVDGGAVTAFNTLLNVRNCTFATNAAGNAGGAINAEEFSNLEAHGSHFRYNQAGSGGAISVNRNASADIRECDFFQNLAKNVGGSIYGDRSSSGNFTALNCTEGSATTGGCMIFVNDFVAHISGFHCANNTAFNGGCLYATGRSVLTIENSDMVTNRAELDGGAVMVDSGSATMRSVTFFQNSALGENSRGGAIALWSTGLTGEDLNISSNRVGSFGGGIDAWGEAKSTISNSVFFNNNAGAEGGAVGLHFSEIELIECAIKNNTAEFGGGVCVETSNATIEGGSQSGNIASDSGGSIIARDSMLNVSWTRFLDGNSTVGGFVHASDLSRIWMQDLKMDRAAAEKGGAIYLDSSHLQSRNLSAVRCSANDQGGAMSAYGNSSVICDGCTFHSNTAQRGGAFSVLDPTSPLLVAFQFERSHFLNNSAVYGGAMHVPDPRKKADCEESGVNCSYLVLADTEFISNRARDAGGAIFGSRISDIHVECSRAKESDRLAFYTREELKSLTAIREPDDVCSAWKDNTAELYGDAVGGYARRVLMTLKADGKDEDRIPPSKHRHAIKNHRSGATLPEIRMETVDGLGRGPAPGLANDTMTATMTASDGFFSGSITVQLLDGKGNLTEVTGFGSEGEYECKIAFSDSYVDQFYIHVQVRGCQIGEFSAAEGRLCEPCSSDTFILDPNDPEGCKACPEDANCSTHVILPKTGYWHRTPCSEKLQKCLTATACQFDGREGVLAEAVQNVAGCDFNETAADAYGAAQCRKGYSGPLCGTCKSTFGRSRSFRCLKCYASPVNVILVLLSTAVLLLLSCVALRGNLISTVARTEKKKASLETRLRILRNLPRSARRCVSEFEMTPVRVREESSPSSPPSQSSHPRKTADEAELERWKAVEVFKIAMNYVQVTAIAVAINVEWTSTLTALFESAEFIGGLASDAASLSVDCLLPEDSSLESSVVGILVKLCIPATVTTLLALFWAGAAVRNKEGWVYLVKRISLSAMVVLYVGYISLTKTLLQVLSCTDVYDSLDPDSDRASRRWTADTSVTCYEGSHMILVAAVSCPLLALISLGFPAFTTYLTTNCVGADYKSGWIYEVVGFAYRSYCKECVFWEAAVMFRKAVLALVVVFAYPLGGTLQAVIAVFVLAVALYFQTAFRPFRPEFDRLNLLESLSILISLLAFLSSIFFADPQIGSETRVLLTIGEAVAIIAMFLVFVFYFAFCISKYLQTVLDLQGVPYKPSSETCGILRVYVTNFLGKELAARFREFVKPNPTAPNHPV